MAKQGYSAQTNITLLVSFSYSSERFVNLHMNYTHLLWIRTKIMDAMQSMHECKCCLFQVMLLDSWLHLPPPVLVITSPSHVMLTVWMGSQSEKWVAVATCVLCHIYISTSTATCGPSNDLRATPETGFGTSATSFSSTLSGTAAPALNNTLVECFGPFNSVDTGNRVGHSKIHVLGQWNSF